MRRYATYTSLFTLGALALAACQDHALTSPESATRPVAAKGGNPGGPGYDPAAGAGDLTARGVKPAGYSGNTGKTDAGGCAAYGGTAFEADGAADEYGYRFAVSGDDGQYLTFSQTAAGYVITAVLVKGGPGFDVFDYRGGAYGDDSGLHAPKNPGGNVPGISHYVVCVKPQRAPTVEKKFLKAYAGTSMDAMREVHFVSMPGTPCDASRPYGGCLPLDQNETLWITYTITYTSDLAGALSDDVAASCNALNAYNTPSFRPAQFECSTAGFFTGANGTATPSPFGVRAGSGTAYITIDIKNNGYCGDRPYTNRVTFRSGASTVSDDETVWIWPRGTVANNCNPNEGQ